MKKKILALMLVGVFTLTTGCSSGPLSAEELAARETESDANLWDEEDYKTIAAKSCLEYKVVFQKAIGAWYGDWPKQFSEYTLVALTSGALDTHPKWNPIAKNVDDMKFNALNRAAGGPGREISSEVGLQAFNLCEELGVDLSE